jgi:hypothetical protein
LAFDELVTDGHVRDFLESAGFPIDRGRRDDVRQNSTVFAGETELIFRRGGLTASRNQMIGKRRDEELGVWMPGSA